MYVLCLPLDFTPVLPAASPNCSPLHLLSEVQHTDGFKGRLWLANRGQLCQSVTWRCSPEPSPPLSLSPVAALNHAHLHLTPPPADEAPGGECGPNRGRTAAPAGSTAEHPPDSQALLFNGPWPFRSASSWCKAPGSRPAPAETKRSPAPC